MNKYLFLIGLIALTACHNNSSNSDESAQNQQITTVNNIPVPPDINLNIVNVYPHDTSCFTEGLQVYNGKMYEGAGDNENSALQISDIKTGKVLQQHKMGAADVFGEGINVFKGKIFQLTWTSHFVNVYDVNDITKTIKTFTWPYEGWGMTNNGTDLIISDGSANLYFVNADDFKIKSTIQVNDNLGPVVKLNELEYINGYIYANVWLTDNIVKIDPANGHVVGKINLTSLLDKYAPGQTIPDRTDVLNGIAYDSTSKKVYVTGKRWPKLFEATLN
ncbi:glutaminyl-peptide cyclotransferase [Ferruginibacter albus]|uniref:glutaminyl-peptide cyclotransferase n=1 Tax=Ferruginibacter albus TaxID=2875540 RepID=UPI001CC3EC0E|nr:glutaminyl-peptide cyclotransferase [Ferruginibacter albus]UAY51112.1 glutaminyl-peptide cyclotransferase [Ferruginibacter albus]